MTVRHPSEVDLSLFAGNDLRFWKRLKVAAHVRRCAQCRQVTNEFSLDRKRLLECADELPAGIHWDSLEREMTGNIHVGFEAGECIQPFARPARKMLTWNLTTALASVGLLALCSLWLRLPKPQAQHLRAALTSAVHGKSLPAQTAVSLPEEAVLEASPTGPSVTENGSSLKLLAPHSSEAVRVSVSLQDSVSTRYVDADSGQVTISKVSYAQ